MLKKHNLRYLKQLVSYEAVKVWFERFPIHKIVCTLITSDQHMIPLWSAVKGPELDRINKTAHSWACGYRALFYNLEHFLGVTLLILSE